MTAPAPATVRFGRLERRGVLLGLSGAQLMMLGTAVSVAVVAEYAAGALGVVASAPVWLLCSVLALVSVAGRPLMAWAPIVGDWTARRSLRRTAHVARPMRGEPGDGLVLPGIPGTLNVVSSAATGAVHVVDPRSGTVTAILELRGRGFILEDPGAQDRRVGGWGSVLASLCQQPDIVRIQVLHRTGRGGAAGAHRWWAEHAMADAPFASRILADLLADAEETTDRQECVLAVAMRAPRGRGRGRDRDWSGIDQQVAALTDALHATDLDVQGPVTPGRLSALLRAAYDPETSYLPARGDGHDSPVSQWVGPMGVVESWDRLRTDSAHHIVYWVQEWPRSDVHATFLRPVLLAPGARRTFTLIAEPLAPGKALRDIRRAKVEHTADAAQRARIGRVEDASTAAEAGDLVRREQDLVAGHGDLRFAGLITVSAATPEELEAACLATEAAAAQAMCELRRLVGQHGQAHAAASLPLARGLL